jgi:3-ketosteroid 9alpha-monooxygenase subunit B
MSGVVDTLKELGFPRERRHQEKFISLGGNPFGDVDLAIGDPGSESEEPLRKAPARVSGDLDGEPFDFDDWPPGVPLLDFLHSKGVQAPFSCKLGECSACACRVIEGDVAMLNNDVLDEDDLADGIRLVCQSLPVTDELKITYSG